MPVAALPTGDGLGEGLGDGLGLGEGLGDAVGVAVGVEPTGGGVVEPPSPPPPQPVTASNAVMVSALTSKVLRVELGFMRGSILLITWLRRTQIGGKITRFSLANRGLQVTHIGNFDH